MEDKSLIEVKGNERDLEEFLKMIKEQNIPYAIPYRQSHVEEGHIARRIFIHVLESVIVEFSKKTVEAIFNWLKERRKKGLRNPSLKVIVEGNILDLNKRDVKILVSMLENISRRKKPREKEGILHRTRSSHN